jgi:hypothetical protein
MLVQDIKQAVRHTPQEKETCYKYEWQQEFPGHQAPRVLLYDINTHFCCFILQ